MSDTPLRPRSITEIVDTAFTLYRRHVSQFVMVAAIAYAPYLLFIVVRGGDESADVMSNAMGSIVAAVVSMISFTGMVHGLAAGLSRRHGRREAVRATAGPRVDHSAVLGRRGNHRRALPAGRCLVRGGALAVTPAIVEGKSVFDVQSLSSLTDAISRTLALVFGIYSAGHWSVEC
jgi:hypothetical protein